MPRRIRLAEVVCKATNYQQSAVLDTLAAAYAEQGNFDQAVKITKCLTRGLIPIYDAALAGMVPVVTETYELPVRALASFDFAASIMGVVGRLLQGLF